MTVDLQHPGVQLGRQEWLYLKTADTEGACETFRKRALDIANLVNVAAKLGTDATILAKHMVHLDGLAKTFYSLPDSFKPQAVQTIKNLRKSFTLLLLDRPPHEFLAKVFVEKQPGANYRPRSYSLSSLERF